MGKAALAGQLSAIKFRQLWNCCWGHETHVITFDNGSRHAVCTRCASEYTRLNGAEWAADELPQDQRIAEDSTVTSDQLGTGTVLDITPNDSGDGVDYSGIWVRWDSESGETNLHYTWQQIAENKFTFGQVS